jgi:O-antigen ligase
MKPDFLYYFTIITFTIQKHIRVGTFDFYLYEVFVFICLIVGLFYILFQNKTASIKTKLDPYLFVLIILFTIGGLTSISEFGYIEALQFYEAVLFYYITIYYLRAKLINPVKLIKAIIFIGIIQAFFAIFQSFIGDGSILPIWISSHFGDNRGYLGALGLGPSFVWHGRGFFTHFIHYGMYQLGLLLFFLPLKKHFTASRKIYNSIIFLFVWAIIISYSRSALLGLFLGMLYYSWFTSLNKKKYFKILSFSSIIFILMLVGLKDNSYTSTLSPRTDLWDAVLAVIFQNAKSFLVGSGFEAFPSLVHPLLPLAQQSFYVHPHSFYLEFALNLGFGGLALIICFLILRFIDTKKYYKTFEGLYSRLCLSVHLVLFSVFIAGIWDRTYVRASFLIFLFSYLGIVYAKNEKLSTKDY